MEWSWAIGDQDRHGLAAKRRRGAGGGAEGDDESHRRQTPQLSALKSQAAVAFFLGPGDFHHVPPVFCFHSFCRERNLIGIWFNGNRQAPWTGQRMYTEAPCRLGGGDGPGIAS